MKKKQILIFISLFFAIFLTFLLTPISVNADTGPKPKTDITIINLEKSNYIIGYGTKYESYYGPHHSFIPNDEVFGKTSFGNPSDLTILYNNVVLPSGWYLSDISSKYENTTSLSITSGYYWPSDFILIIYNELNGNYYLSNETKTYAFHSYFTFDMNNYSNDGIFFEIPIILEKNYEYGKEILEFFIRLLVCFIVELGLALAFRFNKKSLIIITITNAVTQVGLNLFLNIEAYLHGKAILLIVLYIFIEFLIMIAEAIIFKIYCRRGKKNSRSFIILYTILANILSFSLGMILWFSM